MSVYARVKLATESERSARKARPKCPTLKILLPQAHPRGAILTKSELTSPANFKTGRHSLFLFTSPSYRRY